MRALLQNDGFTPEETAGLIIGFCVVGFFLLLLAAYATFLTGRVNKLEERLAAVELHPKLQKGEEEFDD